MNANLNSFAEVATTHIKRLNFAMGHLKDKMPITAVAVSSMSDQDFMYFEVLTGRFAKLQDYVGKQLIDVYLEAHKEDFSELSMIDKLNKLEKLAVLESVTFWDELRQLRNHLIHEYPNQPDITAEYLNKTYVLVNPLIYFTQKLISGIS